MTVEEYRAAILQALLDTKDKEGNPAIEEKEAREVLDDFTDAELEDGILWNTPEEVAALILEEA
jgi:flagellar motor component MotA